MKRFDHIATLLLLAMFLFPLSSYAVLGQKSLPTSLIASGTSPLANGDVAEARKLALDEALRAAVEQSLAWLLPPQRIVHYFPLLQENLLARPMNYVQDYQIISEDQHAGLYRVTVQTTLYTEALERDLRQMGLLLADSDRPRVLLVIAERAGSQDSWHWWWKYPPEAGGKLVFNDSLASSLSARGLVPVVPGLLLRELSQGPLYQQAVLPMEQAVNLAKAAGAQLVVLGKAELQEGSTGRPQVVSADLQALRTDDGALLSQITTSIEVSADSSNAEPSSGLTILAQPALQSKL